MIAAIAFACMVGGLLIGVFVRRLLPGHHLSSDSRDVVKLGAGLIATQAALVLGLLVSSAKGSFDAMNAGITQGGARIILLDRVLSQYGPETKPIREALRRNITSVTEQIWPKNNARPGGMKAVEAATGAEDISDKLRELSPQNESQRLLKTQALQLAVDLSQLRWQLIEQAQGSLPTTFLAVLVFWFATLFASFAILTPPNATVIVVMLVCALSVAGGALLILEMNRPLDGLIKVSGAPFEKALDHLGR
jgi:hypothetical protein